MHVYAVRSRYILAEYTALLRGVGHSAGAKCGALLERRPDGVIGYLLSFSL
eukprot:COSAG03_NODE_14049_length_478_cov_2.730871_1_plen_50_part_10